MGCFGNPIVVSSYVLYNILYCIVKSLSLICGHRHGWSNHVKTSCTVCVIVLSLCSWTNIVSVKVFVVTTKPCKGFRACLVHENKEWEWVFYSFSPLFRCLDNFNDDKNGIKSDSNGKISLLNRISIYSNMELFLF